MSPWLPQICFISLVNEREKTFLVSISTFKARTVSIFPRVCSTLVNVSVSLFNLPFSPNFQHLEQLSRVAKLDHARWFSEFCTSEIRRDPRSSGSPECENGEGEAKFPNFGLDFHPSGLELLGLDSNSPPANSDTDPSSRILDFQTCVHPRDCEALNFYFFTLRSTMTS